MRQGYQVEVLRRALQEIKDDEGRVCPDFEMCTHPPCRSSYGAWAIADKALKDTRLERGTL